MSTQLNIVTPPAQMPQGLSLDIVKNWLRVDYPDDDNLISALIASAYQVGQTKTRSTWVTTTYNLFSDSFGEIVRSRDVQGVSLFPAIFYGQIIPFMSPLQTVGFIKYKSGPAEEYSTWDPSLYIVSPDRPGRISPVYGQPFPIISVYSADCVWIQYTSGWDDLGATIPANWITGALMLILHWYQNRVPVDQIQTYPVSETIDSLFSAAGGETGLWW